MADYQFILIRNGVTTEVSEPIGWDAVSFSLRRSDEYSGLEFTFTDSLQFDREGYTILKEAYEQEGIDAKVGIQIRDCEEDALYEGVINFSLFKEVNSCPDDCAEYVSVGIQQSGLTQRFKNRIDVPVNLFKANGMDGQALTPFQPLDLGMHSQEILFQAEYKINPLLSPFTFDDAPGLILKVPNHVPPLQISSSDIEQAMEPFDYNDIYDQPIFYSGFEYPAGINIRSILVEGRYRVTVDATLGTEGIFNQCLRLKIRGLQSGLVTTAIKLGCVTIGTGITEIDIPFSVLVDVPPDSNIYFYYGFTADDDFNSVNFSDFTFNYNLEQTVLRLSERSILPDSSAKAILVHEAFARICESITGTLNCFRSNYFGGTTSIHHVYESDGCGRYISITNGLNIRQLRDKDGNLRPIFSSFKALFDALNATESLGMRVEEENGVEYIRVEPKDYFYKDEVIYTFKFVKDIERTVALDLIYNEAEFGYQKWETETKSGLDEFNAYHSYALPVVQAKRKLSAISNFVTAGYAIEATRRLQFKTDPNKDSTYDNENFLIACVVEGGFIRAERNENFPLVTGIQSPSTAYNLRFSPARMLLNWYPVLAASMVKKVNPIITFQSGKGNYALLTERVDPCDQAMDQLLESQNISYADVATHLRTPYYEPETFVFAFPISLRTFLNLKAKAIFAVRFGCTETIKGYLKEVTYQPNGDGGIAQFKVIRAHGD